MILIGVEKDAVQVAGSSHLLTPIVIAMGIYEPPDIFYFWGGGVNSAG